MSIERISPAAARRLLGGNRHNRNLRPARVAQFAGAMRRGEWQLDGETVKIAADGTLLDGQHRLHAVIEAGVGIKTFVVRGLPLEAQDTVDTGRRRRLADVLAIEGYPDAHALAAAVNALHRYRTGARIDYSPGNAPSTQQALDLIAEVPEIHGSVQVARRVTQQIGGPVGVFGALHCGFSRVDPRITQKLFDGLANGANLGRRDPVLKLRDQIMQSRKTPSYLQSPYHVAGLVIKAFNLKRAGRRVDLLSFKSTEQFPSVAAPGEAHAC